MIRINKQLQAGQLSEFSLERDFVGQTYFRRSFAGIRCAVFAEAFGTALGRGTLQVLLDSLGLLW
jgi:hypothetical protein